MSGARRIRERPAGGATLVGSRWTVDVGPIAHGGHCVARHEGLVIFVRHALPGERVIVQVTEGRVGDSYVRGDAVAVERRSPHRVTPPCPYAAERVCGGCDFQHVAGSHQRELKAAVVREQLARLAGLDVGVVVQPVPGDEEGLRWRTRVEFAVGRDGRAGLRGHRSAAIVPVDDCLIATRAVIASGVLDTEWHDCDSVEVIDAAHPDEPVLVPVPVPRGADAGGGLVGELAHDFTGPTFTGHDVTEYPTGEDLTGEDRTGQGGWEGEYVVSARGFWQVHPGAASTFLTRVVALLGAGPGDRVLDLYAGSGLFTMRLCELVAPDGVVLGVEGDERAVANGEHNTEHFDNVEWRANRVDRELKSLVAQGVSADLVVLDPPRTGAGKEVMRLLGALGPRRIVYVACDPAALARDVKLAAGHGFHLASLEAWDAFPMTHHVECIAVLEPPSP